MSKDRLTNIAMQLLLLGVSGPGVERLLATHDVEEIERQLAYLPFRGKKIRRPEAFIIEAVRKRFSAPKEYFYAKTVDKSPAHAAGLDQDSQPDIGQISEGAR